MLEKMCFCVENESVIFIDLENALIKYSLYYVRWDIFSILENPTPFAKFLVFKKFQVTTKISFVSCLCVPPLSMILQTFSLLLVFRF